MFASLKGITNSISGSLALLRIVQALRMSATTEANEIQTLSGF